MYIEHFTQKDMHCNGAKKRYDMYVMLYICNKMLIQQCHPLKMYGSFHMSELSHEAVG